MSTIKPINLPKDLYVKIEESAKASDRSVTEETILLLEKALSGFSPLIEKQKRQQLVRDIMDRGPIQGVDPDLAIKWIRQDRNR